ncbi:hypothetical protein GS531_00735 [Rhodococcus hoagii]|nr:hypothetical protein [Prescottella equi]
MLVLILTILTTAALYLVWGNLRRMQLRKGESALPAPRDAIRDTVALARAHRRFTGGIAAAAVIVAATAVIAGLTPLALSWWIILGGGIYLYRRAGRRKELWHSHLFGMADSILHFPGGATRKFWVYITRWETPDRPGLVILRCPDSFTADQFRTAQPELDDIWNTDPLAGAQTRWGFVLKPQKQDPSRYQIVCHPNHKPHDEHSALSSGYKAARQLVALDADESESAAESDRERATLGERLASYRSPGLRVARWAAAALAVWWIGTHQEQARDWIVQHPVLLALLAAPVVFLVGWALTRPRIEKRFEHPLKPGRLLLREWFRLVIVEDRLAVRLPLLITLSAALAVEVIDPSNPLGLALFALWLATGISRTAMVSRPRTKVVTDMYKIAETHLHYSRHYKTKRGQIAPGPWKRIHVQEWTAPGVPGRVIIDVPTGFSNTNDELRRTFEDEFNEKAFPPDADRGDAQGLNWNYRWAAKYIIATPYVPANPADVRWHGRVTGDPDRFYVGARLSDGEMVTLNVQGDSAHILIAGITRSGKTTVGESLVAQRLEMDGEVMVGDFKAHWQRWEGRSDRINSLPASSHEDCTGRYVPGRIPSNGDMLAVRDMLLAVRDEVDRRRALCGKFKVTKCAALPDEIRPPRMFVVLDEFLLMVSKDKGGGEETKTKNDAKDQVLSLITLSRWKPPPTTST